MRYAVLPFLVVAASALMVCVSCARSTTGAGTEQEASVKNEVVSFAVLYSSNCAGCHGKSGQGGGAIALADPVFLAIADDPAIRLATRNGVPGTLMPAFGRSSGGLLSERQLDVIVAGIRSWSKSANLDNIKLPDYTEKNLGDAQRGAKTFRVYCSACHGPDGQGGKAGSITDPSYLSLVSNQNLRTNVILGRPSSGAPDWRNDVPGRPMSEQEIADVVAWLAGRRPSLSKELDTNSSTGESGDTE
jgi:cytochrome c oxidase cbb3-type subunit 3